MHPESNGHFNTLTKIELKTLQPLRILILSGHSPDAEVFDPAYSR